MKAFRAPFLLGLLLALILIPAASTASGAGEPSGDRMQAATFTGLGFRSIGPAVNSGRVIDIAVDPAHPCTWFVAAASGNLWKTENCGTSWSAVFDSTGSYSIGCVTLDPNDPLVVWVGTGENNSQRSVGYGDGVYKSEDGGRTWTNMGLAESEHIGKIVVDPRDSQVVFVAAQGPLWRDGGDRGLYRTRDGGKTWERVLDISPHTGVSDIAVNPTNPDVMYVSAYQRQRKVWTLIDGGPESAVYKTTDGGDTWRKLSNGLPSGDLGRIGLAVAPTDPRIVYALVEATGDAGGFYRSTDAGGTWEKRSKYMPTSPQYYQELVPDPRNPDRVYSMDTRLMVTEDGGKTFHKIPDRFKHVDNHALWIDPGDTRHLLVGCDGGVYETYDRGETWRFSANLPITQFYKVAVDDAEPFYNVYGGTQDNNTLGGPSRTRTIHGIVNSDWFVTVGGDGFQAAVEPGNPDIVYSQWQYGNLVRYDRKNGEKVDIKPEVGEGEPPLRWNWDAPLLISPHSPTRLYFAAQKLFRSDDRGNSWRAVSPDLTRALDRNRLPVMGRVWSVDAVAKNESTSFYGTIVSLAESPLREGLLYVGTDDGLVQVSEDGGGTWRQARRPRGVPERVYVADLVASRHDENTVYAAFDNHKEGDFRPLLFRSRDRGRSWKSIAGDLPERGTTYCLAEDPKDPDLLFVGTEFGVFFTSDGGGRWVRLKNGIPTIIVRDLAVQERESDLVVATFGRGFYVLDDYSPLRRVSPAMLDSAAVLFPVKDAWMYIPSAPLGGRTKGGQGDAFFAAPNPPFGAVFTYYLRDPILSRKEKRRREERKRIREGKDVFYPSWDSLRVEEREEKPTVLLTVTDEDGNVMRRLTGPVGAGFHRVAWDLRYPPATPTRLKKKERQPWERAPQGPLAAPGIYRVSLAKRVDGKVIPLAGPESFAARPLGTATLPARDREALLAFEKTTARLQRAVLGAVRSAREARERLRYLKAALDDTPGADPELARRARALDSRLTAILDELTGDQVVRRHHEPIPPSIVDRVQRIVSGHWNSTTEPTETQRMQYRVAAARFARVLADLRGLVETDLKTLEHEAETAGAPWTPGRVPTWKPEQP